jgi:hypothetical protein
MTHRVDTSTCASCAAWLPEGSSFCGRCGRPVEAAGRTTRPGSTEAAVDPLRPHPGGIRFVLQFSSGESVTVHGSGLIGRSPRPEPAESFDALVAVSDPARSVSKTHLEFGQEDGRFWISDRQSANGSALREPDASPVPCLAGRRYRVPRGSRVDIGDQFFIVS